jgi:hypothetical protein
MSTVANVGPGVHATLEGMTRVVHVPYMVEHDEVGA